MADIEDLKLCPTSGNACREKADCGTCSDDDDAEARKNAGACLEVLEARAGPNWVRPKNMEGLYKALRGVPGGSKYRLVAGNTSVGVYPDPADLGTYISTDKVKELRAYTLQPLSLGGGMPLTDAIAALEEAAREQPVKHGYCARMAVHLRKVANAHVRNVGTLAGNLMMKHEHGEFPSDLAVLLEAAGAAVVTRAADENASEESAPVSEWLRAPMDRRLVLRVDLPELEEDHVFASYKISPRQQNAHAYVNAAFKIKVNKETSVVEERPTLAFGGISESFLRASDTESFLSGKNLNDKANFRKAFKTLADALAPDTRPVSASPEYRTYLAQALLYKVS